MYRNILCVGGVMMTTMTSLLKHSYAACSSTVVSRTCVFIHNIHAPWHRNVKIYVEHFGRVMRKQFHADRIHMIYTHKHTLYLAHLITTQRNIRICSL